MFQGLWPINSDMPPLCVPTHILKLHFNPNDTPVMFHDYCSTDKTQYVPLDTQTPARILNITFVVVLPKTTVYMQTLTVWKVKVLYWIWKDLVGVVINAHCFLSFFFLNKLFQKTLSARWIQHTTCSQFRTLGSQTPGSKGRVTGNFVLYSYKHQTSQEVLLWSYSLRIFSSRLVVILPRRVLLSRQNLRISSDYILSPNIVRLRNTLQLFTPLRSEYFISWLL